MCTSSFTFLRYNSAGQLFCVLCDIPVKSAILWDAHVLGKKHKEVNCRESSCNYKNKLQAVIILIFLV